MLTRKLKNLVCASEILGKYKLCRVFKMLKVNNCPSLKAKNSLLLISHCNKLFGRFECYISLHLVYILKLIYKDDLPASASRSPTTAAGSTSTPIAWSTSSRRIVFKYL